MLVAIGSLHPSLTADVKATSSTICPRRGAAECASSQRSVYGLMIFGLKNVMEFPGALMPAPFRRARGRAESRSGTDPSSVARVSNGGGRHGNGCLLAEALTVLEGVGSSIGSSENASPAADHRRHRFQHVQASMRTRLADLGCRRDLVL